MFIRFRVNISEVITDDGEREPTQDDYARFVERFRNDMEDTIHELCAGSECVYFEMEDIEEVTLG